VRVQVILVCSFQSETKLTKYLLIISNYILITRTCRLMRFSSVGEGVRVCACALLKKEAREGKERVGREFWQRE
jgi:hypothetical protein